MAEELRVRAFRECLEQRDSFMANQNFKFVDVFLKMAKDHPLDQDGFVAVCSGCTSALFRLLIGSVTQNIPAGVMASAVVNPLLDSSFEKQCLDAPVLARQAFRYFDADEDSTISEADLRARLKELCAGGDGWDPLLKFLDVNGDGNFTQSDYHQIIKSGVRGFGDAVHSTLDEVVEILLQESPLVRNVVTMGKLFFSRDGSTLEANALADMISAQPQFSMSVGSIFMALNSVVLVSDGLVALHDALAEELPKVAVDGEVTLESYQEVFSKELAKQTRALNYIPEMREAAQQARKNPVEGSPENAMFQMVDLVKQSAEETAERWGPQLCEGLFHFIDLDGADVVPLARAVHLLSVFRTVKEQPVERVAHTVLRHVFGLISEDGDGKLDQDQCEEGLKALVETIKGIVHLIVETLIHCMGDGFFAPGGLACSEVWMNLTGSREDGPVPQGMIGKTYTMEMWSRVLRQQMGDESNPNADMYRWVEEQVLEEDVNWDLQ